MVTDVAEVAQAESVKNFPPPDELERFPWVATARGDALPAGSSAWTVSTAEHTPAFIERDGVTKASWDAWAAPMVSTWMALASPVTDTVSVGVPTLVSSKKKLASV